MYNKLALIVPSLIFILCNCQKIDHDPFLLSSYNNSLSNDFFNNELDQQNPSSANPPKTDNLNLDMYPFKYPLSFVANVKKECGSIRLISKNDLPIADKMFGVMDTMEPGCIRETHWHIREEWGYVLKGHFRITEVDSKGRAFVGEISTGDIWSITAGNPHSLQSIGETVSQILFVDPGGTFNEVNIFVLNLWLKSVPPEVLAKNFQVPISTFANIRPHFDYTPGLPPRPLEVDINEVTKGSGLMPQSPVFYSSKMKPNITREGGMVKIIDKRNFPITNMASLLMLIHPGGMREMHWHPNADEWLYFAQGCARITLFTGSSSRTMDFQRGDVAYIPKSFGHYIENTGNDNLFIINVFNDPYVVDVSLSQWLAHTPLRLVDQHIRTGEKFIKSIPDYKLMVVPW